MIIRTAPRIIYVGNYSFPERDAGAARVLGIGKALRECGYDVIFAGDGGIVPSGEEQGRPEDRQADGGFAFQGFRYRRTGDYRPWPRSRLGKLPRYLSLGSGCLKWLRSTDLTDVSAIIAYHGTSAFLLRLRSLCRRHNIALIADCTEWFDPRQLGCSRYGVLWWDNEVRVRLLNTRIGHVIGISSFLEQYYRAKRCHVIRVPPLVDGEDAMWHTRVRNTSDSGVLRLVYAGVPGKKDLLDNAIKGVRMLRREGLPVVVDLVGPTRENISALLARDAGCLDELGAALRCHGRVPQHLVPQRLAEADYSFLLRPNLRYAQAGFPTKLVESLSAGVPIITNATSDIAEYVRDGKEGILLDGYTPEAFVAGLRRILSMPRQEWHAMSENARQRAAECFDYRRYVQPLGEFVREAVAATRANGSP